MNISPRILTFLLINLPHADHLQIPREPPKRIKTPAIDLKPAVVNDKLSCVRGFASGSKQRVFTVVSRICDDLLVAVVTVRAMHADDYIIYFYRYDADNMLHETHPIGDADLRAKLETIEVYDTLRES